MKPRTLKAWTKWLFTVVMFACILSLSISEEVQAFSISKQSVNKKTKSSSAILMFTGDLMCLGGQQNAAYQKGKFNFNNSFSYVQPIFSNADLVIGNLETLISESNPYTYQEKTVDGNPNCNAMESYLDALVKAGVTTVVTANNHSFDGGTIGIIETLEKLEEKKIAHIGTFTENKQQQYLICEVNGIKIAILSYTELINARNTLPAKKVNQLISCYSKKKIEKDVKAAKKDGAEFIIAYNHWGTENTHEITKNQQQHAKEMAEAGVDLILGSHPHCLQKAEYIATSDGRNVLCMYSMGNFVSSMAKEINNDTIALEVVLHKNKYGVYTGSIGYYPMMVFGSYQKKSHVVMPILKQNGVDKKYEKKFCQAKERIQKVIGTEISMIQ
ncbi:MAG: CapA family protein [Clostridiales bacterium]|nr:CapA family protein [Clostridiales bacterium]